MTSDVTIVVIGAAIAGIKVSHGVLKHIPSAKIVLVNPHNDYYFNIAAPRVVVKPDAFSADQYLYSIQDAFKKYSKSSFDFILGTVTKIDPQRKSVTIEQSTDPTLSISYDYLVIASGSTTPATIGQGSAIVPFKSTGSGDIHSQIQKSQKAIQNAKTIIIGGGGTVGVEFAGELSDALLGKQDRSPSITLVSATAHLLPRLKDAAGIAAEKILKAKGVRLLASRKVEKAEENLESKLWTVTLDTGEVLTADLYVSTTGVIPNNAFIPSVFLDKDGWIDVDEQLRVRAVIGADGNCAIYAVGDITTFPHRDGYRIAEQVSVVVSNLQSETTGTDQRTSYTPGNKIMAIVPVGKSGGTGQIGSWVLWGFLVSFIKGRDFFVSRASSFLRE